MLRSDLPDTRDLFVPKMQEPAIELKGSVFTLPVLVLRSCDLAAIEEQLCERLTKGARFFENAPIVIDLEAVNDVESHLDFPGFVSLLRERRLVPVGVQHGSATQSEAAIAAGLAVLRGNAVKELPTAANRRRKKASAGSLIESVVESEQPAETPSSDESPEIPTLSPSLPTHATNATVIHQPVRSGQRVIARQGDLIVLAAVNAGAEIIAEGNIHVYAPLRGRALAGVSGNTEARIFCHHMEAELVAVAGQYRVFEDKVPDALRGKAAHIYLEGDQLIVAPLE